MTRLMKIRSIFFILCLASVSFAEVPLGQETINPLRFPKFTFGGEYAMSRGLSAIGDATLELTLKDSFGVNLHAEAGLVKYLNGGVSTSFTVSNPFLGGSNIFRLGLFLKPYFPIGEHFAIFTRLGGGGSTAIINESNASIKNPIKYNEEFAEAYLVDYGQQIYYPISAGIHGMALIGAEIFFTTRFGLMAEFGLRADMLWAQKFEEGGNASKVEQPTSGKPAPSWFSYRISDMPLMINLHLIL